MKRMIRMLEFLGRQALPAALLLYAPFLTAQNATVSGRIKNLNDDWFGEIIMQISQGNPSLPLSTLTYISDANGYYEVDVSLGGDYTVTPSCDENPLNGVTTYDIVLITSHINGTKPFTSPYQFIAADADANGIIDSTDITEFVKLILGEYSELPANSSWRFVPANYLFPDPLHPFPFPGSISTGILTGDVGNVDFIAVKVGDVNGTAIGSGQDYYYGGLFSGSVQFDQNGNCTGDSTETGLGGWIVTANSGDSLYYGTTNADGKYQMFAPPGNYDLWLTAPNALWEICTDTVFGIQLNLAQADTVDFAAYAVGECPLMEVELSAPLLRRCFGNTYRVEYCNKGTVAAENARVEVTFDPFIDVTGSNLPWSAVDGNTYTFELGDVAGGYCGNFKVEFTLSCDAVLGQTHCSSAHIFPDTLCTAANPNWNGGDLDITGECQGDNVVFTITNLGAPMTAAVDYVVVEDIMIQMVSSGSILLGAGESQTITLPANGSTWRLEVDQPAGHPWSVVASAAVEGCGENSQGTFSLGFVTQFANDDESPFEDEDCQANIGSYDPNDKQGFPAGVGAQHYVEKDREIEYLIRFQNTGTDTAFTVAVLDTLPAVLDPATIRPLGSSHPYTWKLLGTGVLQAVFQNILLPDSNVNEAASHGYLRFAIRPKAGLPDESVVENQAAIFFDFNLPVITNRTYHTLGELFLNVSSVSFRPGVTLDVWPNPTAAEATFFLKSAAPLTGRLRVFDARGREVQAQRFENNRFEWNASALVPGLYFFRLEAEDGVGIAGGKVTVAR